MPLAHVNTQDTGEGPIEARMRFAHEVHLGSHRYAVRTEGHPRLLHRQVHVPIAHEKVNRIGRSPFRNQQVTERVNGVLTHHAGDVIHALALIILVLGPLHGGQHDAVPAPGLLHFVVVPAGQPGFDLLPDLLAGLGVFESRHDLVRSAFEVLGGQALFQACHAGKIRVLVGRDIHAALSRLLDQLDLVGHPSPVVFSGHLEMQNVHREPGLLRNFDGLSNCLDSARALAADVGGVNASVFGGLLRKFGQLIRRSKHVGRVDEP